MTSTPHRQAATLLIEAAVTAGARRAQACTEVDIRGGSVCLNRFRAFLKWFSALIMLPPEPATVG